MKNIEGFSVLEMKAKEMTEIQGGAFVAIIASAVVGGIATIIAGTVYAVSRLLSKYPNVNGSL